MCGITIEKPRVVAEVYAAFCFSDSHMHNAICDIDGLYVCMCACVFLWFTCAAFVSHIALTLLYLFAWVGFTYAWVDCVLL